MAGAAGGAVQDVGGTPLDLGPGREQRVRVEVALDGDAGADLRPGVVEVAAPVDPQHVGAGLAPQAEHPAHVGAEVDHRWPVVGGPWSVGARYIVPVRCPWL